MDTYRIFHRIAGRLLLSLAVFIIAAQPSHADLYKWVDEEGTVHMTDTLSQVPQRYRDQVTRRRIQAPVAEDESPEIQREIRTSAGRHEVPFEAYEGSARRIIIPVTFNEQVTARLLLDTGSPGLMISPKLASRLGLIDEELEQNLMIITGGVGGTAPAVLDVVDTVRVGNATAQFLPATIAEVPSEKFQGLVGMDFMANYKVSIDADRNVLTLEELPPRSDRPGGYDESWWRSTFRTFSRLRSAWGQYVKVLEKTDMTVDEKERRLRIARNQHNEADRLYRKLERYARDNTVPSNWRRD